jgi:hypothetical protein
MGLRQKTRNGLWIRKVPGGRLGDRRRQFPPTGFGAFMTVMPTSIHLEWKSVTTVVVGLVPREEQRNRFEGARPPRSLRVNAHESPCMLHGRRFSRD